VNKRHGASSILSCDSIAESRIAIKYVLSRVLLCSFLKGCDKLFEICIRRTMWLCNYKSVLMQMRMRVLTKKILFLIVFFTFRAYTSAYKTWPYR